MDQRARTRYVVDIEVDCEIEGQTHRVFVYDICMDGCMIDAGDQRVHKGDNLLFRLFDQLCIRGEVVWRQDYHAGIRFAEELPISAVLQLGLKPVAVSIDDTDRRDRTGRILQTAPSRQNYAGSISA